MVACADMFSNLLRFKISSTLSRSPYKQYDPQFLPGFPNRILRLFIYLMLAEEARFIAAAGNLIHAGPADGKSSQFRVQAACSPDTILCFHRNCLNPDSQNFKISLIPVLPMKRKIPVNPMRQKS